MFMTANAINYTWRQLAQRVGISFTREAETGFETLGFSVFYGSPEQARFTAPGLVIRRCADEAWEKLLSAPENSLHWIPANSIIPPNSRLAISDPSPVLFWGNGLEEGKRPFAECAQDGSIVFNADILAASFFMLSRWEEMAVPTRDERERFPATASLAYKQGYLDRPIVDEYALVLREWIRLLLPGWEPQRRPFSVKLSHDVDNIRRLPTPKIMLRAIGADLIKRRNPKLAAVTLLGSLDPQKDPFYMGIYSLVNISVKHGFASDAFYFMTADPSEIDCDYDLEQPLMRRALDFLQQKGFEIGFHPGYNTFCNFPLLEEEKSRLDRILGYSNYGGRQHFLRFKTPDTWRHWEEAGLKYDSTLGYADYEGFRCGTCHPYRPFDIEQDRELGIEEWPLVVMEGSLADYRKLQPVQGYQSIMKLAHRCKAVHGTFTLLWHNSSLSGRYSPWVRTYEQVVEELSRL